jgi:Bacillus haemolytic enterotoxin (HBL)
VAKLINENSIIKGVKMNRSNNKNRILHIHDLQQHLQGMSHKNITHYAKNDPIIPLKKTKAVMSENAGYAGAIQNYCTVINAQPEIQFEEIPSIIPSQQLARENADYWMESLNPQIINTYTQVKQFCNYYAAITDEDIELLVNNINSIPGKDDFIMLMNNFKIESDKNGELANSVSSQLYNFDGRLADDLSNFEDIKKQADDQYLGNDGKLQQLQDDMIHYSELVGACNAWIVVYATLTGIGVLTIGMGAFLLFTAGETPPVIFVLLISGIIITGTSSAELNTLVKQKEAAQKKYKEITIEFEQLQTQCAVLQALSDNFTSLGQANREARAAVQHMIVAWETIGDNFAVISNVAQEVVNQNTQTLIKLKLKEARKDVQELKAFAEKCELNGVLPVIPDAELIYRLRLPQSWLKQTIHGDAFRAYVAAKRKKGFFDRGRRGWRTRDQQIYIPLSRRCCG